VCAFDEADPEVFFGSTERRRKTNWKELQLCRQVERAASTALASEIDAEALAGAAVAAVEPAPDARRLRITVVLPPGAQASSLDSAWVALAACANVVRAEVARSIHRKRVPEIVFDLRLSGEVECG
jgi:ribosome-binding factor A